VLGRGNLVESLRRHPLARALRVDKLTLAALEATLRGPISPTSAALAASQESLRARAADVAAELVRCGLDASVEDCAGAVGGGGAPGHALPGAAVTLPAAYAALLRAGDPCVVGRIDRDRCLLDLRCVPPSRDSDLCAAVLAVDRAMR
jgi:L-seryl-tRNA(Ser) seleniumtransferase